MCSCSYMLDTTKEGMLGQSEMLYMKGFLGNVLQKAMDMDKHESSDLDDS